MTYKTPQLNLETSNKVKDCTAIILAGGESKRMGQDKASVVLDGETLLNRAIQSLQPLFKHMIISIREPQEGITLPQVCDTGRDRGPIMGICAVLEKTETPWVFVMAVDMPFVSPELILNMAQQRKGFDAVVPEVDNTPQPLLAFYAKTCLPTMQQHIIAERRSLRRLIENINANIMHADTLKQFDPELLSFFDLDKQSDIETAKNILQKRQHT